MSQSKATEEQLEWIQMKKDFDRERLSEQETGLQKFKRKFNENPFVPIGCFLTAGALSFGLYSFRKGEKKMAQMMMRARIVAQGFTVVALMYGVFSTFSLPQEKKK